MDNNNDNNQGKTKSTNNAAIEPEVSKASEHSQEPPTQELPNKGTKASSSTMTNKPTDSSLDSTEKTLDQETKQKAIASKPSSVEKAAVGGNLAEPPTNTQKASAKESPPSKNVVPETSASETLNNSETTDNKVAATLKEPKEKVVSGAGSFIKILLVLLLLVLLSIAAVGGWWFYQLQQKKPSLKQSLAGQNVTIQQLEGRIQQLEKSTVNDSDARLRQQQHSQSQQAATDQLVSQLELKINSHARRIRELSTSSRADWLLAEAEYLIRLSNQRLITERDTKNATALLLTADEILRDLDEVDLFPVREALAHSITALRIVSRVDREGLYLQLNALSKQLIRLPLVTIPHDDSVASSQALNADGAAESGQVESVQAEDKNWQDQLRQGFNHALAVAGDLVRVRRSDVPPAPLPSVSEDQRLRYNLAILLEQAQLAMLRGEQVIYQESLAKARGWVESYFDLNKSAIQLMEQLAELEQKKVVQELPDISEGSEALRDYIDGWHKRHTVAPLESTQAGEQ